MSTSLEISEDQVADHAGERVWRVVVRRDHEEFVRYFTSPYGVGDRYCEEIEERVRESHYPARDWEDILRDVRRTGSRWSVVLDSATVALDEYGDPVAIWEGLPDYEQEAAIDEEEWIETEVALDAEDEDGLDELPSEVTATKRVGVSGNSLILNMTDELRMMELDYGDLVQVTIRRVGRERDGPKSYKQGRDAPHRARPRRTAGHMGQRRPGRRQVVCRPVRQAPRREAYRHPLRGISG